MSTTTPLRRTVTVTVTRSAEVEFDHGVTDRGVSYISATVADHGVERAHWYCNDDATAPEERYTVSGCFVDNYEVQARVQDALDEPEFIPAAGEVVRAERPAVIFDSEMGQFFAYCATEAEALRLANVVLIAAVEVRLLSQQ